MFCLQYGLYSAFMGGFIYTILGTSKDVTLGPTAIMSLLCFSVVGGQPHRAVLLSLLCGLVQAAMALLRLGQSPRGPAAAADDRNSPGAGSERLCC